MGIKSFSKVFEYECDLKLKDLKNKTIAIDAMYQLHRMAHPFKTTNQSILVGPDGQSTNHINGILALIFNLKKNDIKQYWVFDNFGEGATQLKDNEINRRKSCINAAKQKLDNILNKKPELFSDSEDEEKCNVEINKFHRAAFSLEDYMIYDLKFILDSFDIPWIDAPAGYEAEQVAATMSSRGIAGIKAHAVMTPDPDCLLFGAKAMIKNDKTHFYKYELDKLLNDYNITMGDFIKIGIILGCDFAPKTPKIGPKTILAKYKSVELTEDQQKAHNYFTKKIPTNIIDSLKWSTLNGEFQNSNKIQQLYDWITDAKGFSKTRTKSRFTKAKITLIDSPE